MHSELSEKKHYYLNLEGVLVKAGKSYKKNPAKKTNTNNLQCVYGAALLIYFGPSKSKAGLTRKTSPK